MNYTTPSAIITGASGGIGQALARRFASGGYRLFLQGYKQMDRLQSLARELQEELEIVVQPGAALWDTVYAYPDVTVHLTFLPACLAGQTPRALEHHALRWLRPAEARLADFCPADQRFLQALQQGQITLPGK